MKRIFPSGSAPAAIVVLLLAAAHCPARQTLTWEQVKTRFGASNPELKDDALSQTQFRQSAGSSRAEISVASGRAKGLNITITTTDGRMHAGENKFCALFQDVASNQPAEVQNVSVDFTLLVGRILEVPIKAKLARERVGHFCGQVNLGRQYYFPASYYALLSFTDANGKNRKKRLFLSVR
jgi:hypothetical protein